MKYTVSNSDLRTYVVVVHCVCVFVERCVHIQFDIPTNKSKTEDLAPFWTSLNNLI